MAIALDLATTGQAADAASSLTFSHTVGAGLSNSILIICIGYYCSPASISASTVTYNGVSCTLALRQNNGVNAATVEIWRLVAPTAGANNVVITMSASVNTSNILAATAISLSGVDQTTPLDGVSPVGTTVTGTHGSHSDSITPTSNNAWLVDGQSAAGGGGSLAQNGAQTLAGSVKVNGAGSEAFGASYRGPISPAASTAMSWTWTSAGTASAHAVIALRPATTGGKIFLPSQLAGLGAGGPFFQNPLG